MLSIWEWTCNKCQEKHCLSRTDSLLQYACCAPCKIQRNPNLQECNMCQIPLMPTSRSRILMISFCMSIARSKTRITNTRRNFTMERCAYSYRAIGFKSLFCVLNIFEPRVPCSVHSSQLSQVTKWRICLKPDTQNDQALRLLGLLLKGRIQSRDGGNSH